MLNMQFRATRDLVGVLSDGDIKYTAYGPQTKFWRSTLIMARNYYLTIENLKKKSFPSLAPRNIDISLNINMNSLQATLID